MQANYADHFVLPLPVGHSFPMGKYERLRNRVQAECPGIVLTEALPASDGELALAHTPRYVTAVAEGHLSAAEQREIGFPWSPRMAERARRSVGATIAAARSALFGGQGVAANLAGGTHHAMADKGSGYCVFNDTAVAARLMQAEWHRSRRQLLRVAVIDLDVHQGNGTAAIFRDDDTVFTLSIHAAKNFPFRKEPSVLAISCAAGYNIRWLMRAIVAQAAKAAKAAGWRALTFVNASMLSNARRTCGKLGSGRAETHPLSVWCASPQWRSIARRRPQRQSAQCRLSWRRRLPVSRNFTDAEAMLRSAGSERQSGYRYDKIPVAPAGTLPDWGQR